MNEPELIAQARTGDRDAFAALYAPVERPLAAFLYRLLAERQEAEDLAQDAVVQALETIGSFEGPSFRVWLFRLAAESALARLEGEPPWNPDQQIRFGQRAAEDDALRRRVRKAHDAGIHTTFTIPEHVDYCFLCMGRTFPPRDTALLLLVAVHGFTYGEAGAVLGLTASTAETRFRMAEQALVEIFEPRCSLINARGSCTLCAGYHTLLYGDRRRTEQALFQIDLQVRPTPGERAATLEQRLEIVRSIDPLHAEGTRFHEALMTMTLNKRPN